MTSHRILQLNAVSTAACAVAMGHARNAYSFFGLPAPILLDVLAIGFLVRGCAGIRGATRASQPSRTDGIHGC